MPIEIQSDESKHLTTFTASGELNYEDISDAIVSYYGGAPTPNVLWDMSTAKTTKITTAQVNLISKELEQFRRRAKGIKTAIVAPSDANFVLSRLLQMLLDAMGDPALVEMKLFRDRGEALRWISEEAESE